MEELFRLLREKFKIDETSTNNIIEEPKDG
jgi:hypothetical protein